MAETQQTGKRTPLKIKYDNLPRHIVFEKDVLPLLEKASITRDTFYRDMKINGSAIPHIRLQVYAGLFDCSIDELIDSYVKVKPIIKRPSIAKKVGLKKP
jgi:hypothetical protein